MKNTGENYLKFPIKTGENSLKNLKHVFKSGFLRISGSPLFDYHLGLLIIHGL